MLRALRRSPATYSRLQRMYHGAIGATRRLRPFVPGAYRLRNNGVDNKVVCLHAERLHGVSVTINGSHNLVSLDDHARIDGAAIVINGDCNSITVGASSLRDARVSLGSGARVEVGDGCTLLGLTVVCDLDGGAVCIGAGTVVNGPTELAAVEGGSIVLGADCLLGGGTHFRTGDSHSVVDLDGRRVNPPQSIQVGDHVWVGMGATVLKGSSIAPNSIVGMRAVVAGVFEAPGCAIAGNPAAVVRTGIDWRQELLPWQ